MQDGDAPHPSSRHSEPVRAWDIERLHGGLVVLGLAIGAAVTGTVIAALMYWPD